MKNIYFLCKSAGWQGHKHSGWNLRSNLGRLGPLLRENWNWASCIFLLWASGSWRSCLVDSLGILLKVPCAFLILKCPSMLILETLPDLFMSLNNRRQNFINTQIFLLLLIAQTLRSLLQLHHEICYYANYAKPSHPSNPWWDGTKYLENNWEES